MKALFIGGTGTISMAITRRLAIPDPAFDAWCDKVIEAIETAKKSI